MIQGPKFLNNPLSSAHWHELPLRRLRKVLWAVFFSTSVAGFVLEMAALVMTQRPRLPIARFSGFVVAALFGASAVAFIASKLRPVWKTAANWLVGFLMIVIMVLYLAAMNHPFWNQLPPRLQEISLLLDLMGITFAMLAGYHLFLVFINSEGVAHIRAQNELNIAYRMQSTLVPPVSLRTSYGEVYGRSRPSEQVGGDLVDAAECDGAAWAYIADISGHGLNAGILMGMCKTAIRTALLVEREMSSLIDALNRVLPVVKESNMYATLGCLRFEGHERVEYTVAGSSPHSALPRQYWRDYPPVDGPVSGGNVPVCAVRHPKRSVQSR